MMKKPYLSLLLFFCLLSTSGWTQSAAIKPLYEEDLSEFNLYFYPSTLRMLNVSKDPAFNEMIKDVKNLRILIIPKEKLEKERFMTVKDDLAEEQFEELISMKSNFGLVHLLGLYEDDEMQGMVALVLQEESYIVVELIGAFRPEKAMEIANGGIDLGLINKFMGKKEEEDAQREKWKKIRQEVEAQERAEDSLKNLKN
ncbi:DUF4252 domain-containing protein [Cytophagales bacterium LB-30]|uniref:DUF4252 domain-containing protein n=1 Tax=Shiella aurantiaca TaxID=3058365 RepID=A0ABT8F929_9BACT|nr:DUF4252 domain-containing protein [Shiella aurantiaca]MDN4166990.1 DUF4252 domain-containing protein [Shiella aurantiaca]